MLYSWELKKIIRCIQADFPKTGHIFVCRILCIFLHPSSYFSLECNSYPPQIKLLVMCLSTKDKRVCAQRNTSKESISPFLKVLVRSRCDHYILQLTNAEPLCYLNFPSTNIFCSLLYMSFQLSKLPVAFDNKHSQLLTKGRGLIMSGKGSQYHSNHLP